MKVKQETPVVFDHRHPLHERSKVVTQHGLSNEGVKIGDGIQNGHHLALQPWDLGFLVTVFCVVLLVFSHRLVVTIAML